MNRLGTLVAAGALIASSGCGGGRGDGEPAPSTAAVDWPVACQKVASALQEHTSDVLPTADDYSAFADEVGAEAEGVDPSEARVIRDVESAGRLSAEVEDDASSGPDERLEAREAVIDSLEAMAAKCESEGSAALS